MAFFFTRIVRNIIFVVLFFNAAQYYMRWKAYTVSVKDFKALSTKSADQNPLSAASRFASEIRRRYPQHIPSELHWVPISAGGMHLKVQFLYGDLTEYVALWSSVGQTSGRSGFHWVNSTCTVLSGELGRVSDSLNTPVKETFTQGQNFRHAQYESYVYFLNENTLVSCYGRGFMPVSSIWTTTGALANGDLFNWLKLNYAYGRLMFDGLTRNFHETYDYVKKKATKMEL
ncbi:Sigma 1-type opioid receptor [Aphelenchoides besseyi]|nr:Sigma 1-type opioid receptor [Aphelenchoides besseyi]KAI6211528.1 Sigma 1-type opioid receptor [Aphelenchoides besseyi]